MNVLKYKIKVGTIVGYLDAVVGAVGVTLWDSDSAVWEVTTN